MCQPVQNYVLGGHWGLFVTVFLTFLSLATCARLNIQHSAFESIFNSSVASYRTEDITGLIDKDKDESMS